MLLQPGEVREAQVRERRFLLPAELDGTASVIAPLVAPQVRRER